MYGIINYHSYDENYVRLNIQTITQNFSSKCLHASLFCIPSIISEIAIFRHMILGLDVHDFKYSYSDTLHMGVTRLYYMMFLLGCFFLDFLPYLLISWHTWLNHCFFCFLFFYDNATLIVRSFTLIWLYCPRLFLHVNYLNCSLQ